MAVLTPVTSNRDGAVLPATTGELASWDEFANTGKELIWLRNTGIGSINIQISAPALVDDDLTIADRQVTLNVGETKIFGPYPTNVYGTTLKFDALGDGANLDIGIIKPGA